jgi:hypothetical protein
MTPDNEPSAFNTLLETLHIDEVTAAEKND